MSEWWDIEEEEMNSKDLGEETRDWPISVTNMFPYI